VHAPSEEKSDVSKDSLCEELEQVSDHFRKYHMKISVTKFHCKIFSNRQMGMRVYIRMIMVLE